MLTPAVARAETGADNTKDALLAVHSAVQYSTAHECLRRCGVHETLLYQAFHTRCSHCHGNESLVQERCLTIPQGKGHILVIQRGAVAGLKGVEDGQVTSSHNSSREHAYKVCAYVILYNPYLAILTSHLSNFAFRPPSTRVNVYNLNRCHLIVDRELRVVRICAPVLSDNPLDRHNCLEGAPVR